MLKKIKNNLQRSAIAAVIERQISFARNGIYCDKIYECSPDEEGCQKKVKGGAVQLVLHKVAFDSYPYHRAGMYSTCQAFIIIIFYLFLFARSSKVGMARGCLLYTSPSPRDRTRSRMPSSA